MFRVKIVISYDSINCGLCFYTQKGIIKKWFLFLTSIPIAVAGNIGRILSIALVSMTLGQQFGSLHHDWSGYVLFSLAIGLMIAFGKVLKINYKNLFIKWKKTYLSPS